MKALGRFSLHLVPICATLGSLRTMELEERAEGMAETHELDYKSRIRNSPLLALFIPSATKKEEKVEEDERINIDTPKIGNIVFDESK